MVGYPTIRRARKHAYAEKYKDNKNIQLKALEAICYLEKQIEKDWMLNYFFQHHWRQRFELEDGFDYIEFCGMIERGEIYLSMIDLSDFAHGNSDIELNRTNISKSSDKFNFEVTNSPQGFDGCIEIKKTVVFKKLYLSDDRTPNDIEWKEFKSGYFPLEIGTNPLAKSIMTLRKHGCIARVPYEHPSLGNAPKLALFKRIL